MSKTTEELERKLGEMKGVESKKEDYKRMDDVCRLIDKLIDEIKERESKIIGYMNPITKTLHKKESCFDHIPATKKILVYEGEEYKTKCNFCWPKIEYKGRKEV